MGKMMNHQDIKVKDVVFRMIQIPPGQFLMGSPEKEFKRWADDEKQHEVILTQGFWLGETACTQKLWKVVMGNNPSEFKGPDRPVENVSWDDCMHFCKKINRLIPDLGACLPTEAQWEYACRAGTTTPFSFGENITTDQVNFDGNNPYADGPKGEWRKQTVDVATLPCNEWGLYEMHGNVWEWCADWYGNYPGGLAVDPQGPDVGMARVLRGGSWFSLGRFVRSACRDHDRPGGRNRSAGFRLARGHRVLRGGCWINDGWDVRSPCRVHFQPGIRVHSTGFRLAADMASNGGSKKNDVILSEEGDYNEF